MLSHLIYRVFLRFVARTDDLGAELASALRMNLPSFQRLVLKEMLRRGVIA